MKVQSMQVESSEGIVSARKLIKIPLIIPIFLSKRWTSHRLGRIQVATKIPNQYPKVLIMFMMINLAYSFRKVMWLLVGDITRGYQV
jgi:hypothetical protein